jgi:hypothetical protein
MPAPLTPPKKRNITVVGAGILIQPTDLVGTQRVESANASGRAENLAESAVEAFSSICYINNSCLGNKYAG